MFLLAGLMGMMAVGAAALWGLEDLGERNDGDQVPRTPGDTAEDAPTVEGNGPSIMDIATDVDPQDPEGDDWNVQSGGVIADTMTGTAINDFLNGYEGDDTILGLAGTDELRGGEGDDSLSGGAGDDSLHGDAGDDTLQGDGGADSLYGHGGDDFLDGGDGDDSLSAGQGDDSLSGGAGNDALHGYIGNDFLDGGPGEDTLFGGEGNDTLEGRAPVGTPAEADRDFLNGGPGDDVIFAGGNDIVTGGAGADQIILGEWLSEREQASVLDFTVSEDSLLVFYDETETPDPEVTVKTDEADESLHHVFLNGVQIANVQSATALSLDDIVLVPQETV